MHQQTKRALDRIKKTGFADRVLRLGEDPNELYELCDQLLLELSPCGPVQEECLLSIAGPLWRKSHPYSEAQETRPNNPLGQALEICNVNAELDAQINQAIKQMLALKQMQNANTFVR